MLVEPSEALDGTDALDEDAEGNEAADDAGKDDDEPGVLLELLSNAPVANRPATPIHVHKSNTARIMPQPVMIPGVVVQNDFFCSI
jgi:hypothetical protein